MSSTFKFNVWLYNAMKEKHWDEYDLELESGVGKTSIECYLKSREYPTMKSFEKILKAFNKHAEIIDN